MAISKNIVDCVDHFAGWRDVASDKGDETHFEYYLYEERVVFWDWIQRVEMADIGCSVFIEQNLFQGYRDSEEGREGLLELIPKFPTFFAFIILSNSIALFCHANSFLKHLIKNIIFFDSNFDCPFNKSENNFK